jgi:signal transduction histidine kinase/DNA-binding response OmpR family regulator
MKKRDETQVVGTLFLSFGQACVNSKIFIAEEAHFLEHITAEGWYPLEKFSHILDIVREKYSDPAPILEQIGIEMMNLWYSHGPGKHIIQRGIDFLHFQTSSEGYYSVIRGEPDHIGDFSLLSLDEGQGTAIVQSTTPFSRDMESGVLIGGLGVVRDLLYIDVENTENEDIFRIRFRGVQKVCEKRTPPPEMPEDVDVTTLYWKHKMLKVNLKRYSAFWNSTNDTLSQAFETLRKQGEELQERTAELLQANTLLKQEIAERKRVEEELRYAKDVADEARIAAEEAQQRALEAQHAAEDAQKASEAAQRASEAANRTKSAFLANMSHELRTPLNAVLGYAQILSRSQTLSAEDKTHLNTISRSGEHLLALINDVLELSKIDANHVELQPVHFDLHQQLVDLEAMFRLRAERKGLSLEIEYASDMPTYICADQNKLRQILINLLGNAVKYTEKGSVELRIANCELRIEPAPHPSQEGKSEIRNLKFEIRDSGIGIAPADLEKVFDAFVRVDEQQYNTGTGLGLPISQKYIHMMGGDIHVESAVGKGSTFSFEIPVERVEPSSIIHPSSTPGRVIGLEPEQRTVEGQAAKGQAAEGQAAEGQAAEGQAAEGQAAEGQAAEGSPYRLLIVDDDNDNRDLLVHILQSIGFSVREAHNGAEAVDMWKTWQPHLIWMDMRMPVMDGYTATRRIRAAEAARLETRNSKRKSKIKNLSTCLSTGVNPKIPIIALTASAFEEDREQVIEAGCDDFVRKPFRETEIFDMLHKYLGVRFVYEAGGSSKEGSQAAGSRAQIAEQHVLTPEALTDLPAEWLTALEHGARETNTTLLLKVIEQIRPQNAAVAEELARLTHDFEYDTILAVLQQAKERTME